MKRMFYLITVAVAFVLRAAYIWRAPLWYDENFSLLLAKLPFDRMISATAGDTHPPLWYAILWVEYHLGFDLPNWCIRIPALLFGVLACMLFWRVLGEVGVPDLTRKAAMLIFVLAPIQLWYSQEGRMYTLFELEMLAGFWAILEVRSRWPWLTLAMAAMLYTQNYGVFFVGTLLAAWAALRMTRATWRQVRYPLAAAGLALMAWIPLAIVIVTVQMPAIHGSYWIQPITAGYVLQTLVLYLFINTEVAGIAVAAFIVFFFWLCLSLYSALRTNTRPLWTAALIVFLPLALAVTASLVWSPILLYRPLLASSPFLYWLLASPLELA